MGFPVGLEEGANGPQLTTEGGGNSGRQVENCQAPPHSQEKHNLKVKEGILDGRIVEGVPAIPVNSLGTWEGGKEKNRPGEI